MATSTHYPDFFARFYDVIYKDLRTEDRQFFMHQILHAGGPVLEVGVGTGRFFMEALEKGVDVYGIDISSSMIGVLHRKLQPEYRNRVVHADMCTFQSQQLFSLIVAPFRVFMHIDSIEDQLLALNTMHRHLVPGGVLLFDLFVPNLKMLLEGLNEVLDFEGEYEPGKMLRRYTSMQADPVLQTSRVTFRLQWEEADALREESWETTLRFFFYHELQHLLSRSDFSTFSVFGDFARNPVSKSSREFIIQCTK